MAAPGIYRSTDGGAPTLSGSAGALLSVLDYALVSGQGWTKPYTAANGAAYKQPAGGGFYLQVDDSGPGAGGAREARTRGFETMSAWNTGTGLFPTVAQLASGPVIRKSSAADATSRAWIVAADDRTVYLFTAALDAANTYYGFMFGDIYSAMVGDNYKTAIMGRSVENTSVASNELFGTLATTFTGSQAAHYLARSYSTSGGSIATAKFGDFNSQWLGSITFPNPVDGGLYLSRVRVNEPTPTNAVRGYLRGIWQPLHAAASFADGDTFDGMGQYAGRTFLIVGRSTGVAAGNYVVETTAWDMSA